ncbi:MAG: nitroreductase family protein [Bacillota bacterium]
MNLETVIRERRSIRKFRDQEVPGELLEEIIGKALWAPSGMNRQDWHIVVAKGGIRDRLAETVQGAKARMRSRMEGLSFPEKIINMTLQFFDDFGGAPVVVLVYITRETYSFDERMGRKERYHLEFKRYNCLLSAAAFIQTFLLAACSRGLGTCWMTGPKYMEDEINSLLGISGDKELVSIIPVGYPDQTPPAPPRKVNSVQWIGF